MATLAGPWVPGSASSAARLRSCGQPRIRGAPSDIRQGAKLQSLPGLLLLVAGKAITRGPRRPARSVRWAEGDEKVNPGLSIMEELRRKAREDFQRRESPGWETEMAARFQVAEEVAGFEVKEAKGMDEVWGAAELLTDKDNRGDQENLDGDANPFLGLGLMRAYSALSPNAPLTAIARTQEGVIGMAQVKKDGYVQNLVVKPSGRRKGIASQIICWCAARARRRGAARLWLHVEAGNEAALSFYRRLGFEVGEEETYREKQAFPLSKAVADSTSMQRCVEQRSRGAEVFTALDVGKRGWVELRYAIGALAAFGLSKKEHLAMAEALESAARPGGRGSSDQRHVDKKKFIEALKPSPGAASRSKSWTRVRGAVRFAKSGRPDAEKSVGRKDSPTSTWDWPTGPVGAQVGSPASSRPSSRSDKSPRSPAPDPWWHIPQLAPAGLPATPDAWRAAARRAEQEGRNAAAAEIALLRMTAGLQAPAGKAPEWPKFKPPAARVAETVLLSSVSTSAGSAESSSARLRSPGSVSFSPRSFSRSARGRRDAEVSPRGRREDLRRPRVEANTAREKSNWSPCKWPPSARWPSTQLPHNVNNWPIAGDDKPTGLDTWTHLLFSTGLRSSPLQTPFKCGQCRSVNSPDSAFCRKCGQRRSRSSRSASPGARPGARASARSASAGAAGQSESRSASGQRSPRERSSQRSVGPAARGVTRQVSAGSGSARKPRNVASANRDRTVWSTSREPRREASSAKPKPKLKPKVLGKPSTADLVRLQRELKAQIDTVSRALEGPRAARQNKAKPKASARQLKENDLQVPQFRFS
ncbi:unnamed protein product [Effrenium voratum]|nr:unnamed protein product [Effrenium voratum]